MFDNISVTGISSLDKYPNSKCKKYYKQCLDDLVLCIPHEKPDMECINEVNAKICVDDYSILNTILGPKLFIKGRKNIKIIYTADNCQQSLHSAHWSVPFCEFILLKDLYYNECQNIIEGIFIGLEDICIKHFEKNVIDLSLLFIICPNLCDFNYCHDCQKNYMSNSDRFYCDAESFKYKDDKFYYSNMKNSDDKSFYESKFSHRYK
jgi:hypothetical protein